MAKRLAIAVTHGMGPQAPTFAEGMIEEVNKRVGNLGKNSDEIAWQPVFWADILKPRQTTYLNRTNESNDLNYLGLRRFVVGALGDATAYQQVTSPSNTTYELIHRRVREKLRDLKNQLEAPDTAPLIVIAHSLGGHIMSNYIWDIQDKPPAASTAFERIETLAGMVTFGCNIPLFTLAYTEVMPIRFPARQLPPDIKSKAKWFNYYDPNDILGYPLKPINAAYNMAVTEDKAINVGGLFPGWNLISHGKYWTDNDFTKPVAEFIAEFL